MVTWSVRPEIFTFGPLRIRWYGAIFGFGFILGYSLVRSMFIRDKKPEVLLDRLFAYMLIGTLGGARLGHTLFYEPDIYLADPLRILMIWEGGLASHGAVIGVVCALWIFSRQTKIPYRYLLDRLAVAFAMGGSLVRLGNLMNSEIIGKPTDVPWAFIFTRVDQVPRHPTQIYESFTYMVIFGFLYALDRKPRTRNAPGFIFGMFLVTVFIARFFLEFFKERQVAFEAALPLDMGQLLSIPFVLLGIWLIWTAWKTPIEPESAPLKAKAKRPHRAT